MLIINVKVMVDKSVDDENDVTCNAAQPSLLEKLYKVAVVTSYN